MICSKSRCSTVLFNQSVRCISRKVSLISKILSKLPKKSANKVLLSKEEIKKPRKKKLVSKQKDTYDEKVWLESLNAENLKLYRRTPTGSFRLIHTKKLIDKLKVIYPELKEETQLKVNETPSSDKSSNSQENPKDFNLQMCQFLLENILTFPLFYGTDEKFLKKIESNENEAVNSSKFPSVTKILNKTMSESNRELLDKWEQNMILKLGFEKFIEYKKDVLSTGIKLHGCLRQYLETKDESKVVIDPAIEGCWNSVRHILKDISEVKMVEQQVHHPVLMYKGVVDCIANYRDVPCVIEWKKSEKKKLSLPGTYDAPLQLCAYMGAVCWQRKIPNLQNGLVVVIYTDGTPATVLPMDLSHCEHYWVSWLQRLQTYWGTNNSELIQSQSKI